MQSTAVFVLQTRARHTAPKNKQMRMKHAGEPEKFMESELELNDSICGPRAAARGGAGMHRDTLHLQCSHALTDTLAAT